MTTYNEIYERFNSTDGNVQVTTDELVDLDVLKEYNRRTHFNPDVVMAKGKHSADPKKWYLCRTEDGWLALKYLYKMIDSEPQYYVTGIGQINVDPIPLDDGFGEETDLTVEQVTKLRNAYEQMTRGVFDFIDETWAASFDGATVFMEIEDPWAGWKHEIANLSITENEWRHEIQPKLAAARPDTSRVLDTTMTCEHAVSVSFN